MPKDEKECLACLACYTCEKGVSPEITREKFEKAKLEEKIPPEWFTSTKCEQCYECQKCYTGQVENCQKCFNCQKCDAGQEAINCQNCFACQKCDTAQSQ